MNLTDKELLVLACLIHGDTNRIIARKTGISIHTIKAHLLKSIFAKLEVENRTQAAVWAWRHGIDVSIQRNGHSFPRSTNSPMR